MPKNRQPVAQGQARPGLISPRELADYCGVPLGTVYQWSHRGTGPKAVRIGKHLRYQWADVESWLDAQAKGDQAS